MLCLNRRFAVKGDTTRETLWPHPTGSVTVKAKRRSQKYCNIQALDPEGSDMFAECFGILICAEGLANISSKLCQRVRHGRARVQEGMSAKERSVFLCGFGLEHMPRRISSLGALLMPQKNYWPSRRLPPYQPIDTTSDTFP